VRDILKRDLSLFCAIGGSGEYGEIYVILIELMLIPYQSELVLEAWTRFFELLIYDRTVWLNDM
jgi:hypothetical protein